jgi:hypothetical protein
MGLPETLVHTYDVAAALGVATGVSTRSSSISSSMPVHPGAFP